VKIPDEAVPLPPFTKLEYGVPFEDLNERFVVSDDTARSLARTYGTPLYVLSEAHFRHRIRRYQAAFKACWPKSTLTYASKANSTLAVLAIAYDEGCLIDVASEGELRAALAAGVPAHFCHLHGNFKKADELRFAIDAGVDQIMVDSFEELACLRQLNRPLPSLMLRLAPGVRPQTNSKISTGQDDTKFGFNIADGSAARAVEECAAHGMPLRGFHAHVGSQLLDPDAQRQAGSLLARFAIDMLHRGIEVQEINVGGGLGVRYLANDAPMEVEAYCQLVVGAVQDALAGTPLMNSTLTQEPGRTLIAECGVTLYTVGPVKTVPTDTGTRTYATVDGGLSDNPRPALYGGVYDVRKIGSAAGAKDFTIAGRHCETDRLFSDVSLPSDLKSGDLLQVLCTGAYNSSMASNYNRFLRPATVLLREDGTDVLVQSRETYDQMFAREINPFKPHASI
jgi:diaminopimelate decarboxylase